MCSKWHPNAPLLPGNETVTWIQDKTRVLEDTDELTNDLSGVMKLQRRLSMMERDLGAIQAKLDNLEKEADKIEKERPEQAQVNVRALGFFG